MAFNFDSCPERAGTDSTKWHKYHDRDVIPCWIADMDFESAPAIVEAVKARAAHGVLRLPGAARRGVRLGREPCPPPAWLGDQAGVDHVHVLAGAGYPCEHPLRHQARRIGRHHRPVYPPFLSAPVLSERNPLKLEMVFVDGRWTFDWAKLEAACAQPHAKVLLLCNPYNPLARVFDRAGLDRLAALGAEARPHGLLR
jgi:cystathionine beta-lyase